MPQNRTLIFFYRQFLVNMACGEKVYWRVKGTRRHCTRSTLMTCCYSVKQKQTLCQFLFLKSKKKTKKPPQNSSFVSWTPEPTCKEQCECCQCYRVTKVKCRAEVISGQEQHSQQKRVSCSASVSLSFKCFPYSFKSFQRFRSLQTTPRMNHKHWIRQDQLRKSSILWNYNPGTNPQYTFSRHETLHTRGKLTWTFRGFNNISCLMKLKKKNLKC